MRANYFDGYYQAPKSEESQNNSVYEDHVLTILDLGNAVQELAEAQEDRAILAKKLRDERNYSTQLLNILLNKTHEYQKRIEQLTDELADLANLG